MQNESSYGPIIGLIIIIVIIALGSVYFLQENTEETYIDTETTVDVNETGTTTEMQSLEDIELQSSDDTLDAIEGDIDDSEIDSLLDGLDNFEDLGF